MRERTELGIRSPRPNTESRPGDQDGHEAGAIQIVRETVPVGGSSQDTAGREPVRETVPAALPRWFGSGVRVVFGLIWLADVYFKWQPSFLNGLLDVMHDGTMGQPGWLMPWFNFNRAVIAAQPTVWAYSIALVETGIALAVLLGFARKVTYIGGAVWSLVIWATAEGFGRMSSGVATDIGTGVIYTVVFLALLAADRYRATRPYSLDALLERRFRWWARIAEVRGVMR